MHCPTKGPRGLFCPRVTVELHHKATRGREESLTHGVSAYEIHSPVAAIVLVATTQLLAFFVVKVLQDHFVSSAIRSSLVTRQMGKIGTC